VRQTLFLTSNYFHNLMLVHASEAQPDVPVNVRATLEAAHDAITTFFVLFGLFEAEARVWWVFVHRAFLEALCIGGIIREALRDPAGPEAVAKDPLFVRAKADISEFSSISYSFPDCPAHDEELTCDNYLARMIQIMQFMGEGEQGSEVARTRVQVLSEFLYDT
jgi:hypothetical protein